MEVLGPSMSVAMGMIIATGIEGCSEHPERRRYENKYKYGTLGSSIPEAVLD